MAKTDERVSQMAVWESWPTVPKQFLRAIPGTGGLSSINATWQTQEATRMWGPYGLQWGIKDLKYEPIVDGGHITTIAAYGTFFYPHDGSAVSFPVSADMDYRWGPNSKREGQVKDDIWKKLLTELQSKALLKLGCGKELPLDRGKYPTEDDVQSSGSGELAQAFDQEQAERRGAGAGSATGDAPPTPTPKKPRKAIDPAEDQRHREEITQMLAEMYGDNADEIAAHIERACGFQGDRGWVSKSRVEDLKGAWLAKTRNKVREDYEKRG